MKKKSLSEISKAANDNYPLESRVDELISKVDRTIASSGGTLEEALRALEEMGIDTSESYRL